jgi:hypothetical protein
MVREEPSFLTNSQGKDGGVVSHDDIVDGRGETVALVIAPRDDAQRPFLDLVLLQLKESPESTVAGDDPPVLVKHEYRVGEALDEDPVTAEDLFRLPGLRDDA